MKVKLPSFVRSLLYPMIDFAWEKWLFPHNYNPRRTIIVSGTPRGGTTWLAETLAATPGYLQLFEPLNPWHIVETVANAPGLLHLWEPLHPLQSGASGSPGIGEDLYATPKCLLHEHIKRTISGKIRFTEYYPLRSALRNMKRVDRLILKFIRANLLLHWMLREFDLKGALIIRHPCAVVASQLHQRRVEGWKADLQLLERMRRDQFPIYEQFDPSFVSVIRSVKTDEELLALEWCIRTIVPLRQPKPHPWVLTVYESLIEDIKEWEMLCGHLDCPLPSKDVIARPSSTYQRKGNEASRGPSVDNWRRHLSEKQIDDILRVCAEMGVDFYDKTPYPKNLDKYR